MSICRARRSAAALLPARGSTPLRDSLPAAAASTRNTRAEAAAGASHERDRAAGGDDASEIARLRALEDEEALAGAIEASRREADASGGSGRGGGAQAGARRRPRVVLASDFLAVRARAAAAPVRGQVPLYAGSLVRGGSRGMQRSAGGGGGGCARKGAQPRPRPCALVLGLRRRRTRCASARADDEGRAVCVHAQDAPGVSGPLCAP